MNQEYGESRLEDARIPRYIEAMEQLASGQVGITLPPGPVDPDDTVGQIGSALNRLARRIQERYAQAEQLATITDHINAGLLLDEILDHVYDEFHGLIPYERIGFSLIEPSDHGPLVRARWARTSLPVVALKKGYAARLAGSSLEMIVRTGQPRIINDLAEYARLKPESQSTKLILEEGIRASLTCPLVAEGSPVGFMFFSSVTPGIYANAHVALFRSIAGQLATMIEKGRLVSEIVAQREAIDRQNRELRYLNDMKTTFIGIAAHDLRNPLGNIQMSVELLRMPDDQIPPETKSEILDQVMGQTQFMLGLLNDLLDVAQIESGKISLSVQEVDIPALMQATVKRHAQLAAPKGTQVVIEQVDIGTVHADPARLRQVLDNLISNAVKYSPPGSLVRVRADRAGGAWRFSVADQGPGITLQDRERLFQDFARLSAQPTGGEKSTGLGLSITRRIVESHGGAIGVDSEPGHGATFWFTLPGLSADGRAGASPAESLA